MEHTIRDALDALSMVMVNAVFHPDTYQYLPTTVEYLSSLGVRQIYLNPDFSAEWQPEDAISLPHYYDKIGKQYIEFYLQKKPHFISLIDSKISLILRNGYEKSEKCNMGVGELAFTTDGSIFPCERLVGDGNGNQKIGHVDTGVDLNCMSCNTAAGSSINSECLACPLKDYCMNWCGCSNYFSTGYYNRAAPILCASEKSLIKTASEVFNTLENKVGHSFFEHLAGTPQFNSTL